MLSVPILVLHTSNNMLQDKFTGKLLNRLAVSDADVTGFLLPNAVHQFFPGFASDTTLIAFDTTVCAPSNAGDDDIQRIDKFTIRTRRVQS